MTSQNELTPLEYKISVHIIMQLIYLIIEVVLACCFTVTAKPPEELGACQHNTAHTQPLCHSGFLKRHLSCFHQQKQLLNTLQMTFCVLKHNCNFAVHLCNYRVCAVQAVGGAASPAVACLKWRREESTKTPSLLFSLRIPKCGLLPSPLASSRQYQNNVACYHPHWQAVDSTKIKYSPCVKL